MGSPLDSLDALMATMAPSASISDLLAHGAAPGMDAGEPLSTASAGMDPLSLLQLLSSDAAQRRTPAAGVPTIRPTTAPTKKSAPIVVAPGGDTPTTAPGKFDWPALLKLAAPILGSIANRGDHGAFMTAYLHAQDGADQEKAIKEAAAQKLRDAGADYLLKIGEHAQGLTDPADFQNFLHLAEAAGVKAGYLKPGELTSQLTFPASKASAAKLKKLNDLLDAHEKAGYDLDALAKAGASLDLDGTEIPVRAAMDLTHRRPLDASGQPVGRPKKADVNAATAEERFLAKWAKEHGTTVDQLTSADELAARKEYAQSGRSPVDPDIADMHKNLLGLQIQIAQERADAAKVNGTPMQIKPGTKEYRVAQDLAYGRLTMGQFRSLYSYARDVGAKTAIYQLAGELNPAFNPAAFEMGFTLAKNPKVQQQLASMDNVREAVPDLLAASDAAKRSGVTALNAYTSPIRVAIGSRTFSNLRIARTAFADELSGALGFGSATDMSREMGFDMTDPNLSPENFRSGIQDIVIPFVERKRTTLLKQMGPYGQPGVNPAAEAPVKQKIGRFDVEVAP